MLSIKTYDFNGVWVEKGEGRPDWEFSWRFINCKQTDIQADIQGKDLAKERNL